MSNPNPDRDQRVERLIEHLKSNPVVCVCKPFCVHWEVHAKKVLTPLLDSQAAVSETRDKPDFYETLNLKLSEASRRAATRMREACVEKVRELRGQWHDSYVTADTSSKEALVRKELLFSRCQAANKIIAALESLTLEQGEQEKR